MAYCYNCEECQWNGTFVTATDLEQEISESRYDVAAGTREICPDEFLFTPLTATPHYIEVATTTGNYGVYGTDSFYGRSMGCIKASATEDVKFVEVGLVSENNIYQYGVKDPTLINTDADIDALRGKHLLLHFDATTRKWTVDNTVASAPGTNLIEVVGGSARNKTLQFKVLVS